MGLVREQGAAHTQGGGVQQEMCGVCLHHLPVSVPGLAAAGRTKNKSESWNRGSHTV